MLIFKLTIMICNKTHRYDARFENLPEDQGGAGRAYDWQYSFRDERERIDSSRRSNMVFEVIIHKL